MICLQLSKNITSDKLYQEDIPMNQLIVYFIVLYDKIKGWSFFNNEFENINLYLLSTISENQLTLIIILII